jgi:hypothetical protein
MVRRLLAKKESLRQKSVNKVSKLIFDINVYKDEESVRAVADNYITEYTVTKSESAFEIVNVDNSNLENIREIPMFDGISVVMGDSVEPKQKEDIEESKEGNEMAKKNEVVEVTVDEPKENSPAQDTETVAEVTPETLEIEEEKNKSELKKKYDGVMAWYMTSKDSEEHPASLADTVSAANDGVPIGAYELIDAFYTTLVNIMRADMPDINKVDTLVNDFKAYLLTLCGLFITNNEMAKMKQEFFTSKEEDKQVSNETGEGVETTPVVKETTEPAQEEKPAEAVEAVKTVETATEGATAEEEISTSKSELANADQVTTLLEAVQALSKKLEGMENANKESILNLETKLSDLTQENKSKDEKIKKLESKPMPSNAVPEVYNSVKNEPLSEFTEKYSQKEDEAYLRKQKRDIFGF